MKMNRALIVVPSLESDEGGSINETEFIKALAPKFSTAHIITFSNPVKYFFNLRKSQSMSKKFKSTVFNLPDMSPPFESGLSVITLPFLFVNSLVALFLALLLTLGGRPDFVYIRDPRLAIAFSSAKRVFPVLAIKYPGFYVQESKTMPKLVGSVLERVNSVCINAANPLIVHSELYEPILKERYSTGPSYVEVVQPGVHVAEVKKLVCSNVVDFEFSAEQFKVGFIGSAVSWWNGADIMVEAMGIVAKKNPNAVLVMAGLADKDALRTMQERCVRLGVKAYFLGLLPHKKALQLVSKMDVIVSPRRRTLSTETTIPIKIAEAFALGRPVIMTMHKILELKYTDSEDLLFCEPNPQSVANRIIALSENPQLSNLISANSLKNADKFDYETITKKLLENLVICNP